MSNISIMLDSGIYLIDLKDTGKNDYKPIYNKANQNQVSVFNEKS